MKRSSTAPTAITQSATDAAGWSRFTLIADPHRPRYHFLPPANWLNDPNGLIEFGGLTHLFYQYNPHGAFHGTIHWGHAVSRDLVHWEDWPIALSPTPGGADQNGCWSGCAVNNEGTPTLLYTALEPQNQAQAQRLATSTDGLKTWCKRPDPVIVAPPADLAIFGTPPDFRDPFVWREAGAWFMAVGSGISGEGGAVLLYRSADLTEWQFLNVLHRGRFAPGGEVWECPNLFRLADAHVLLVSEQPEFRHTYYQLGKYAARRFTPSVTGKTDYGRYFYAALTLEDSQQRRLMWGWLKEGRSAAAQRRAGWAGVMSLPRRLQLGSRGLEQSPIPELETLREAGPALTNVELSAGEHAAVWELPGNTYEFYLDAILEGAAAFALTLCATADGREKTTLRYDADTLTFDARGSSLGTDVEPECVPVPHLLISRRLELRVFVDRSVIEVFADRQTCITSRIYPTLAGSGLGLECLSGKLTVKTLRVWPLKSIWP